MCADRGFGEVDRTDALFLQGREDRFVVCGRGERRQFVREHLRRDCTSMVCIRMWFFAAAACRSARAVALMWALGAVSAELVHEVMVFADVDTAGFAFADSKLRIGLDRDPAVTKRNLIGQVIFQAVCEIHPKKCLRDRGSAVREFRFPARNSSGPASAGRSARNGQRQADKNGDDAGFSVFLIFSLCFRWFLLVFHLTTPFFLSCIFS